MATETMATETMVAGRRVRTGETENGHTIAMTSTAAMSTPQPLVVAISSRALFDLDNGHTLSSAQGGILDATSRG